MLHNLVEQLFYRSYDYSSCLQISARDDLVPAFPGLGEFKAAKAIETRHKHWIGALPASTSDLWPFLQSLDQDNRATLFAHCAGLTINQVEQSYERGTRARSAHAGVLASALGLDMTAAGWTTTATNFLGRVTKTAILDAVREAKGDKTADLLVDLKKKEMACEAERLLAGTGWLPEPLRTPEPLNEATDAALPAFLDEDGLDAAA